MIFYIDYHLQKVLIICDLNCKFRVWFKKQLQDFKNTCIFLKLYLNLFKVLLKLNVVLHGICWRKYVIPFKRS